MHIKAAAGVYRDTAAMIDKIIARYDRPVPRYTSYPTAPHFTAAITAGHYYD